LAPLVVDDELVVAADAPPTVPAELATTREVQAYASDRDPATAASEARYAMSRR
jgi:hypothetical protein